MKENNKKKKDSGYADAKFGIPDEMDMVSRAEQIVFCAHVRGDAQTINTVRRNLSLRDKLKKR